MEVEDSKLANTGESNELADALLLQTELSDISEVETKPLENRMLRKLISSQKQVAAKKDLKPERAPRKLTSVQVRFFSLFPKGANRLRN